MSRGTVRRAMSDLVNEGILFRVQGKGTFITPGKQRQREILVFSPWNFSEDTISLAFYGNILLKGIYDAVRKSECSLLMKHFNEESLIKSMENGALKSNGIIIINTRKGENARLMHKLALSEVPFVVVGSNIGWGDINCVAADNIGGVKSAFDYLVSLGHRKISFIGANIENYDSYERLESFKAQCRAKGISDKYVYVFEGKRDGKDEFEDIFLGWKKRKDFPSALITGGFSISLIVLEIIRKYKLKIPADISVLGFDDFPAASHLNPALTVVKQPLYEMGKESVVLLLNEIEHNKNTGSGQTRVLPTELIIRSSCAKKRR